MGDVGDVGDESFCLHVRPTRQPRGRNKGRKGPKRLTCPFGPPTHDLSPVSRGSRTPAASRDRSQGDSRTVYSASRDPTMEPRAVRSLSRPNETPVSDDSVMTRPQSVMTRPQSVMTRPRSVMTRPQSVMTRPGQ